MVILDPTVDDFGERVGLTRLIPPAILGLGLFAGGIRGQSSQLRDSEDIMSASMYQEAVDASDGA